LDKKALENKDLLNKPEDIYKIKIENIENFQEVLKNKTLNDLKKLPDSPIDLPIANKIENIYSNSKTEKQKSSLDLNSSDKITKKNEEKIKENKNHVIKEKNTLISSIDKKENFRFLNKLSDINYFDLLKFRQNNNNKDFDSKNIITSLNNSTFIRKNDLEIPHALTNKIQKYYSDNQKYLEKFKKNFTQFDQKFLGIENLKTIENTNNHTVSNLFGSSYNFSNGSKDNLVTSLIQTVKNQIGINFNNIESQLLHDKSERTNDLKSKFIFLFLQIFLFIKLRIKQNSFDFIRKKLCRTKSQN